MTIQASFLVAPAARVAVSLSPEQFAELRDKCHRSVTFLIVMLFEFIMHPRRPLDRCLDMESESTLLLLCALTERIEQANNWVYHDTVYRGV